MKRLFLILVILIFLIGGGYFGIKLWIFKQLEITYNGCKNTVSQEVFTEMNSLEKNDQGEIIASPDKLLPLLDVRDKLISCTIDELGNKYKFLDEKAKTSIKRKLELELYLEGN